MTQTEQKPATKKNLERRMKELEDELEKIKRRLSRLEPSSFPKDDPHENDL